MVGGAPGRDDGLKVDKRELDNNSNLICWPQRDRTECMAMNTDLGAEVAAEDGLRVEWGS